MGYTSGYAHSMLGGGGGEDRPKREKKVGKERISSDSTMGKFSRKDAKEHKKLSPDSIQSRRQIRKTGVKF